MESLKNLLETFWKLSKIMLVAEIIESCRRPGIKAAQRPAILVRVKNLKLRLRKTG